MGPPSTHSMKPKQKGRLKKAVDKVRNQFSNYFRKFRRGNPEKPSLRIVEQPIKSPPSIPGLDLPSTDRILQGLLDAKALPIVSLGQEPLLVRPLAPPPAPPPSMVTVCEGIKVRSSATDRTMEHIVALPCRKAPNHTCSDAKTLLSLGTMKEENQEPGRLQAASQSSKLSAALWGPPLCKCKWKRHILLQVMRIWKFARKSLEDFGDEVGDEVQVNIGSEVKGSNNNDRRDWEPIRTITNEKFQQLLLSQLEPRNEMKPRDLCRVVGRREGSFHYVVFLVLYQNGRAQQYVIKVPAHGTPSHWTEKDAYMLRAEVHVMKHILIETHVPVAEIMAYDDTLNNEICAPFIIMKKLPGKTAEHIWFDDYAGEEPEKTAYLRADCPSEKTKRKRLNFLRSLAAVMAELQEIECNGIGVPFFEDWDSEVNSVDHFYRWHDKLTFTEMAHHGPLASSKDYFLCEVKNIMNFHQDLEEDERLRDYAYGVRKILDVIFATLPFTSSKKNPTDGKETFVLRHDDLDLQNILTDEDGNVTGILDWDGCMAVPRCVGYATLPIFVRRDWISDFDYRCNPHMTWMYDYYRAVYADAMRSTESPDAKYTGKSHLYQAAMGILYESHDISDFVYKVLLNLPGFPYCALYGFIVRVGQGWPDAEVWLREEIAQLFAPDDDAVGMHIPLSTLDTQPFEANVKPRMLDSTIEKVDSATASTLADLVEEPAAV